MKILCLIAFVFVVHAAQADALGDEVAALKIKLPADRQLSSNELRQVVQLAHRGGMGRVAEIQPLSSQRGAQGLTLSAKEVVKGRWVLQSTLGIWPTQWWPDLSHPHPYASNKGRGRFLLDENGKYEREWATFTIQGKTVRLECSKDTTDLAEADRALDALLKGRVDFKDDAVKARFKSVDTNLLRSIQAMDKGVGVGFNTSDPSCGKHISGELKEDRIVIGGADTVCS